MGKTLIIKGADFSQVAVAQTEIGVDIFTEVTPAGGGSVSGGGYYSSGTTVELVATPNTGYKFSKWSDGVLTAIRTIIVGLESATYTAEFEVRSPEEQIPLVLEADNSILDPSTKNTPMGRQISNVITSGYNTFQIYKGNLIYDDCNYRVTLYDNFGNNEGAYTYVYLCFCNASGVVTGYVAKSLTGQGQRTFEISPQQYENAESVYISTNNRGTVGLTALAPT